MMQDKREKILQSALELFSERGFDGTNVPLIASQAGVGAGTIYRYFTNKEALVNALYQHWKERFRRHLMMGFPAEAAVRVRFSHLIERMAAFADEHTQAFIFLETHNHRRYLDEASQSVSNEVMSFLRGFVEEGISSGEIRPLPPDMLIALVYGSFIGLFKALQSGELIRTPELLHQIEQCCWDGIRFI